MKKTLLMIALVSGMSAMGAARHSRGHSKEEIEAHKQSQVARWIQEQDVYLKLMRNVLSRREAGEGEKFHTEEEIAWISAHPRVEDEAKAADLWNRIARRFAEDGRLTPEQQAMYEGIQENKKYLYDKGWKI